MPRNHNTSPSFPTSLDLSSPDLDSSVVGPHHSRRGRRLPPRVALPLPRRSHAPRTRQRRNCRGRSRICAGPRSGSGRPPPGTARCERSSPGAAAIAVPASLLLSPNKSGCSRYLRCSTPSASTSRSQQVTVAASPPGCSTARAARPWSPSCGLRCPTALLPDPDRAAARFRGVRPAAAACSALPLHRPGAGRQQQPNSRPRYPPGTFNLMLMPSCSPV